MIFVYYICINIIVIIKKFLDIKYNTYEIFFIIIYKVIYLFIIKMFHNYIKSLHKTSLLFINNLNNQKVSNTNIY